MHIIYDNTKKEIVFKGNDLELIDFVKSIINISDDDGVGDYSVLDISEAVEYIENYSCNLNHLEFFQQDSVVVPEPIESDIHNHEFEGVIIQLKERYAVVEDGEGNCFDIEYERLNLIEE